MINIKIDNRLVEVKEGTPVISALRNKGIEVPSMCYREGSDHITSCMVCLVKDSSTGRLFPSCSVAVSSGMDIISMDDEIREARQTALELLLSEHVGDCEAPCQITCPAHMNIPLMNRLLAEGKIDEALEVVRKDIALPSVFGRICPAPCEGACRRKSVDEPVSICLLKRAAGDHGLAANNNGMPRPENRKNKTIAIIGAGPAGLAAACFLQLKGYDCTVYDRHELPGGSLHREVKAGKLPAKVLHDEVEIIRNLGVRFIMNNPVDRSGFMSIRDNNDAMVIATGMGDSGVQSWGLEMSDKGINADRKTYQIADSPVFVAGSALRPSRMAIRALGEGKELAFSIDQYLQGKTVCGEAFRFNSRFGKLFPEEISEYLKESKEGNRIFPEKPESGFSVEELKEEASRCLHCDCRELDSCSLRIFSDQYKAKQSRFKSTERKQIKKHIQHDLVIFEPAKCIRCGICVKICSDYREEYGLTFIGRGFEIEVGVPFRESIKLGLKDVAEETALSCPTSAISLKNKNNDL